MKIEQPTGRTAHILFHLCQFQIGARRQLGAFDPPVIQKGNRTDRYDLVGTAGGGITPYQQPLVVVFGT